MRILGSLRAIPGALWTRESAAVETPSGTGGTGANRFRRTVSPPPELVRVSATAYPDGLLLRLAMGRAEADGEAAADAIGVELTAAVGEVSAVGEAVAGPAGVALRLELGIATASTPAVAVNRMRQASATQVVYVPVPSRRRKDAIDRAWTELQSQREEDELLELLGVFD